MPLKPCHIRLREKKPVSNPERRGFTLTELLVVIAIMGILSVISLPSLKNLKGASDFTRAANSLVDTINLARSYAMANNTYVFLGLVEVDRTQSPLATPQSAGTGRLVVAVVASKDGTSGYDPNNTSTWGSNYNAGSNLALVYKPQIFDFTHIASSFPTTTTGNMARPSQNVSNVGGDASTFAETPFSLPLGAALSAGQYNFTTVISFNSQGTPTAGGQSLQWIEIDLQPMNGGTVPAVPTNANQGNQAAILVDGSSGVARLYRP